MKGFAGLIIFFILIFGLPLSAMSWDFSRHDIPTEDIFSGGPPKDGIPALLNPKYVNVDGADFMRDDERVLGVYRNGIARAFPTRILSWHEIVNARFGEQSILVSW